MVSTTKFGKEEDKINRDEVLSKSIKENRFLDEKEQLESIHSFGFAGVIVVILCVFFSIVNSVRGQSFYEFGVIIFAYLAASAWRTYFSTHKKGVMIQGIISSLGVIITLVGYLMQV